MARRLVEREARSGCRPAPQHPPVQDLHEFAATASPRRATRCDARVPEQPPVLRQRIQKTRARPLISAALPEAVTTTHPRVWRAPRDSRAYVSMPPPALLRLLFYAASRGRRRKCRHLRGVLYHSSPAPCRSTGRTRDHRHQYQVRQTLGSCLGKRARLRTWRTACPSHARSLASRHSLQ